MRPHLILPRATTPHSRLEPATFFAAVDSAFQQAASMPGGLTIRDYCIGGYHVRLRFAGLALMAPFTPALAHLASSRAESAPDLLIDLWDTASTGVAPPPPAWNYDDFSGNGLIRGFSTDRLLAYYQFGINALSLVDVEHNHALYWIKSADQIPYWDRGAPLRAILALWLSRRGRMLVHAGAVGLPQGGVLLAGAGGAGKSNIALSTLPSALGYASDDFSLLGLDPEPTVYSLYATGKTHPADLDRLPFLRTSVSNPHDLETEKALFFLSQHWAHKLLTRFPLKAILLPHITGRPDSQLRPAGAAEGLNALTPSTLELAPSIEAAGFQLLVQIFRQVPCYHLDLGTDRTQPPQLILDLLTTAAPTAAAPDPGPG